MLYFGVTIPVTVPQMSEIPKGLMNYPVHEVRWAGGTWNPAIRKTGTRFMSDRSTSCFPEHHGY